jgi:hypothetical protein
MVWSRLEDGAGANISLNAIQTGLTAWRPIDKRAKLVAGFVLTRVWYHFYVLLHRQAE